MRRNVSLVEHWPLNAAESKQLHWPLSVCDFWARWITRQRALQTGCRITQRRKTLLTDSVFFHALSPSVKTSISTVRAPGLDAKLTGAIQDRERCRIAVMGFRQVNIESHQDQIDKTCQHPTPLPKGIKMFRSLGCVTDLKQMDVLWGWMKWL